MSGIEVVGLVLGAIPLVIAALEHYEDVIDPTIAFVKYRGELSRAIRELGSQHASFEQTMQILLVPITDEEDLNDMIENTDSPCWNDPSIDDALQKKLGGAYPSFFRTIKDINQIIVDLVRNLSIKGADKITQKGLEAIISANPPAKQRGMLCKIEFTERIKFTMKRQRIKSSLDELKSAVGMLDTFYSKASKLEEPYKPANRLNFAAPLHVIQENAEMLYNVISRTWCSNHQSHSAGLLLEQRLVRKNRKGLKSGRQKTQPTNPCDPTCFGISLQAPSLSWLDVEFRLLQKATVPQTKPSVQFILTGPTGASQSPLTTTPAGAPYADPSKLQLVTNICSVIQQPASVCIGFCIDSNGHLRGNYPIPARSAAYVHRGVSLEDILANNSVFLNPQEQYSLSITLVASLLQLGQTPWLENIWNKANILFLREKPGSVGRVDVQYPYIVLESSKIDQKTIQSDYRNDSSNLLALGVLLLEISHRGPIESLWRQEDVGSHRLGELANLNAARKWLIDREQDGLVSFSYRRAIQHCLKCFVDPGASLANEDFARTVKEQVLVPLEEEMNIFTHGRE